MGGGGDGVHARLRASSADVLPLPVGRVRCAVARMRVGAADIVLSGTLQTHCTAPLHVGIKRPLSKRANTRNQCCMQLQSSRQTHVFPRIHPAYMLHLIWYLCMSHCRTHTFERLSVCGNNARHGHRNRMYNRQCCTNAPVFMLVAAVPLRGRRCVPHVSIYILCVCDWSLACELCGV